MDEICGNYTKTTFLPSPTEIEISRRGNYSSFCKFDENSQYTAIRKQRRKQLRPQRSVPAHDPFFRGAEISMRTVVEKMESRLEISCSFQLGSVKRRMRKYGNQCRSRLAADKQSSVDTLEDGGYEERAPRSNYEKHCASCSVKKTPLWRDAEDGTPLCNACGIRYKKYKIRCTKCWHIPKKDEFRPNCLYCGSCFQFAPSKTW